MTCVRAGGVDRRDGDGAGSSLENEYQRFVNLVLDASMVPQHGVINHVRRYVETDFEIKVF